jgi:hypothetical protein
MKKFLVKSTLLLIAIYAAGGLIYSIILPQFYYNFLWLIPFFFYLTTNLVHAYLLQLVIKANSTFASKHMAISFLKMFFYLGMAIVYLLNQPNHSKVFIVNYLILYATFSVLEVSEFSKFVRNKNN